MLRATPAIVLLVAVLAGCGGGDDGDSTADFKKKLAAVDIELKATGTALGNAFQTATKKTDAELAVEFDDLAARIRDVNARLAKLDAPDNVKDAYVQLQQQLAQVRTDVAEIAAAARAHDAKKAEAASAKTVTDSAVIKPTANKVRRGVGLKESP